SGLGHRSAPLDDGQPDAAVLQCLFADLKPLGAGFDTALLDGVKLEEAIEVLPLAPAALVVVEADLAGGGVDDDRVAPARQADEQAGGLAAEQAGGALDGLGQAQAPAGGGAGGRGVPAGAGAHANGPNPRHPPA